ncbi:MAG: alkaline phosphatase [Actinomycetota bacterium]|jgi:alkaline phosphatase D
MNLSRRSVLALGAAVMASACSGDANRGAPTTPPAPSSTAAGSTPTTTPPSSTDPPPSETTAPPEPNPLPEPSLDGAVDYGLEVNPFTLGVASGDAFAQGVVLWTRLAPSPLDDGGLDDRSYLVTWEMALEEGFEEVIRSGVTRADPEHAHSVHVDVRDLEPAVTFWYRFRAGSHTSGVGRTSTLPLYTLPESFVLATATCANYAVGYFTAYRDLAESKPDAVLFVGDYIYEVGARTSPNPVVRAKPWAEVSNLDGYRRRYALNRTDRDLQAAHAVCPWYITWSDHEVDDNYAANNAQTAQRAGADFAARRDAAYKAWWEHMPVRLAPPQPGREFRMYRRFAVGSLVDLVLLDTRQYRSSQACDGRGSPFAPACPEVNDAGRTMLGAGQEAWVADTLERSTAAWTALASDVLFSDLTYDGAVLGYDQWDGYPAARARLLETIRSSDVANAVVLSGDTHFGVAAMPGRTDRSSSAGTVAVEFTAPSITTPPGPYRSPMRWAIRSAISKGWMPEIIDTYFDRRGWAKHTITPDTWTTEFRAVQTATRPRSSATTARTYRVRAGSRTVERLDDGASS